MNIPALVIGAGPAGLMAAERLCAAGHPVAILDAMASPARKFLRAGIGGLNLTHSETLAAFTARYGACAAWMARLLDQFGPDQLRAWAAELGVETFVGSSGRVFPTDFKAAPLLRAWLRRLRGQGATLHARHRWLGWDGDVHRFATPEGELRIAARATVLALGGGSWPQLGSDGSWVDILAARNIPVAPLKPANCGFDVAWSEHFRERFAGQPVKPVALSFAGRRLKGEFVITRHGIEGGAVYALSAALREALPAVLELDLKPDWPADRLAEALARPRGSRSLSSHLEKVAGLKGVAAGLLREGAAPEDLADMKRLAARIKALPLRLDRARPLAEAISTAGGIAIEALTDDLMLRDVPGLFAAGEMLDWEAPTGGYLLTGCFATGRAAGDGAARWLREA